jgi:hypothetical protein
METCMDKYPVNVIEFDLIDELPATRSQSLIVVS